MQAAIYSHVSIGDYVRFFSTDNLSLGEIIHCGTEQVRVKLFRLMTSEILQRFKLRAINSTDYPLASQDNISEVYQTSEEIIIDRPVIMDVAFIVPILEVESGMFYLSGAENTFCVRYAFDGQLMKAAHSALYFDRYLVEPLGIRLFNALNTLSQHLRRIMYHQPESASLKKTFRLALFPMECFWYLVFRVGNQGLFTTTHRKQSIIKYYNCLRMECTTKVNTLTYLRILSRLALKGLRKVLGIGAGIGLAKKRPKKSSPIQCCTIGGILTSIECPPEVPLEILLKPTSQCTIDGIDFIYYETSRCLSCIVRFTKITVNTKEDVTERIAVGEVNPNPESGVYVNVWFRYEDMLLEVTSINEATQIVTCSNVEEEGLEIDLPLDLVSNLVKRFGNS